MALRADAIQSAPKDQGGRTRKTTDERTTTAGPHLVPRDERAPSTAVFRIDFDAPAPSAAYALAVANLLGSVAEEVIAVDPNGQLRDALELLELRQRIRTNRVASFRMHISLGGSVAQVGVVIGGPGVATSVSLTLPFVEDETELRTLWLQADPEHLGPVPSLPLSAAAGALTIDALHALVALGARVGGFVAAELRFNGATEARASWFAKKPDAVARPIVGTQSDCYWLADAEGEGGEDAVAWFVASSTTRAAVLSAAWCEGLKDLLRQQSPVEVIEQHLRAASMALPRMRLVDRKQAPDGPYAVPAEDGVVLSLHPETDAVVVAIDLQQPAAALEEALLHALAHLALDHVRPGDDWGHWDTASSLSPTPHRQWDREARVYVDAHFARPIRCVSSLEECNPREKAWLVLFDHIGRMVGQTHTLHAATESYQAAAYQRQAAQRLVAQLEEYGGAMLCDGVGLGKTYVATTVVVHYANAWRDQLAAAGRTAFDDPFRVTVLSPNSVVSTWHREAIAPLAAYGVPLATIRVISHSKLSRIVPGSDILKKSRSGMGDMEHLLLSDLVVVDEAHNFRSVDAKRATVLRDLLRLQPRRDLRRKVLLLTATPVNNGLEDLRQQAALMFGKPLWLNESFKPDEYRACTFRDVEERIAKAARSKSPSDVTAFLIRGNADSPSKLPFDFRDDVQFGVQVPRVGDYLKEQEKRLVAQQVAVRTAIQSGQTPSETPTRIAGELLDRIVVQRSRALCKQIEREHGSNVRLLFRPDTATPEKLVYEDVYDDTRDVLARFLPLFETGDEAAARKVPPLSLKVYMWTDVRDGVRDADGVSSVVGLQRVLVLKRLESSPVAFLITLLRLLALHARRLKQLSELCRTVGDRTREKALDAELSAIIEQVSVVERERLDLLLTSGKAKASSTDLLDRWSKAYTSAKVTTNSDDPLPAHLEAQPDLFPQEDEKTSERREQLDRLWNLREDLTRDMATLLRTAPGLADIVFGRFAQSDWPQRFINGGQDVDWPTSARWALRLVTDGKLRRLVARLLRALSDGQKVVVFSQFTDSLAYVASVLHAASSLERDEWKTVLHEFSADAGRSVPKEDVLALIGRAAIVSGETEDRDSVIHAFAPFYRLGPSCPRAVGVSSVEQQLLDEPWRRGWTQALKHPIDVLFATDVLAEGVNLQDAALLINFDVHWNPVRMIQRAGRIDRRLNPAIEEAASFPELEALARDLNVAPPRYWWHEHTSVAPVTVNLLLPDELEAELQLRERIANKTLAIDFTLGLEQGTGAEADWMAEYRYQGISALNAWQGDRAIEQIAGYQQRLRRMMADRGIEPAWLATWNGWLREISEHPDNCILAWAKLGRKGGETTEYTRHLQPRVIDGIPHWLWTTAKPAESLLNFWLCLDGKTFPALTRTDLAFSEDASRPIAAEDLLVASRRLLDENTAIEELGDVRRPLLQGASAISAGFLGAEPDRRAVAFSGFRLLQLRVVDNVVPARLSEEA